uniref:Uncharacterized protein n=1 Tax=Thermosphaera aggregans TaxID=54254 RepID=A0A7C2FF66_9CREN
MFLIPRSRKPDFKSSRDKASEASTSKAKEAPVKKKSSKTFSIDDLVDKMSGDVLEYLGLNDLSIPSDLKTAISREVIEAVTSGYSSKPDVETVLKRIKRNIQYIYELVVSKILESMEAFDEKTLEYVVYRGGRAIIPSASKLYSLARKYGREDLILALQATWNKHMPKELIECPRCGFNSISTDLSCTVCGNIVSEQYVRTRLDFTNKFKIYVESASVAELRSVLEIGYVLASSIGVYNPRSKSIVPGRIYYQIYLKPSDISLIIESINQRDIKI